MFIVVFNLLKKPNSGLPYGPTRIWVRASPLPIGLVVKLVKSAPF